MNIRFINHSCILIEKEDIKIICDPWLEERVFDNGWDLIVPSAIEYQDFETITHIWFSHEHPDHFFPPNIKKIAPEHRKNITVLFQKTIDRRVLNYCKKMEFKAVVELEPEVWQPIDGDLKVMCENYTEGDSWLALQSKEMTVLNTNDCEVDNSHDAKAILKKIGGKVDLLLAQFSYACWAGNKEQEAYRKSIAKKKLDILIHQIKEFTPQVTIPIASYVWFCHQDNFYLNDLVNKPDLVEQRMKKETKTTPAILFPGESYSLNQAHDNQGSIKKWLDAYQNIAEKTMDQLEQSSSVQLENLFAVADKFGTEMQQNYGMITKMLKPATIYLYDYKTAYQLTIAKGLEPIDKKIEDCDVALSSDSLLFCLKFPFGTDTLGVNGKFRKPKNGSYSKFYNYFRFNQLKSRGIEVNANYLMKVAFRKVFSSKAETSFYS